MRFELFIAIRYLLARRGQALISVISALSVIGVALGVASLIVIMGIMNGFTTDLREKIVGVTAHAVILGSRGNITEDPDILVKKLEAVPGVTGATPFIYSELMLSTNSGVKGVVLRGIDPKSAPKVLGAMSKITEGSIDELAESSGLPGILVGKDLANKLGLFHGNRVNLLAPSGQQSSTGYQPKIKSFRVVGVFKIGLYEYDSSLAFVSLQGARDIIGWPDGMISGVEIKVADLDKAEEILEKALATLEPGEYFGQSWITMNSNLFSALKLEKTVMAIFLILLILVSSFSIVTALVMLVMEKTRDIAIMMSMGATARTIRRIFMFQGIIIGIVGTSVGCALGLVTCFLLERYKFIELPPGVYSLDYVPVLLEMPDIILTLASALLLCFLATIYPSRLASSLEPVEALRHE